MSGIIDMTHKVPELEGLDPNQLKNLILSVMAKHRNSLSYLKTNVHNDDIQEFEEILIEKLIEEYNHKNDIDQK